MLIEIHPVDPQARKISEAAQILRAGGILVYPTDSSYALCCAVGNKEGMDRITQIREKATKVSYFTLVCRDLSDLAKYAMVDNRQFRLLKAILPGAYTLVLKGSREVPKRLLSKGRDTVGLRVPDHPIVQALLEELGEPLLSTTLKLEGVDRQDINNASLMHEKLGNRVDAVIDGGPCSMKPTSVIDLSSGNPEIIREGQASVELFT